MLHSRAARAGMLGAVTTWATCQPDWALFAMCWPLLPRLLQLLLLLRLGCLQQASLSAVPLPAVWTSPAPVMWTLLLKAARQALPLC